MPKIIGIIIAIHHQKKLLYLAERINSAGQTLNTSNNRTTLIAEKLQCHSLQPSKCLQRRSSLKTNKANDNQEICDFILHKCSIFFEADLSSNR